MGSPSSDTKDEITAAYRVWGKSGSPRPNGQAHYYHLFRQGKLVDLAKQFWQPPREPLAAWLLYLWDLEVDSIMCNDNEMEKLASVTTHSTLCQQLQSSPEARKGTGLSFSVGMGCGCDSYGLGGCVKCARHCEQMAILQGLSVDPTGVGHAPGRV